MFNHFSIKKDFPILSQKMNGQPLVYLDNAATTQKPKIVISALKTYYETMNANIHRGIYELSEKATEAYEKTREHIRDFLNAASTEEIIFTRNCTEAINLVAYTWGEQNIQKGDTIVVTALEHHSNLVPWQILAQRKKANLMTIPLTPDFRLDMEEFERILSRRVKLVCVTAMSNVIGVMPDIEKMVKAAHQNGAKVLVDGAQSVAHTKTDVQKPDCDFFAFSGHKIFGPTGVGVLYGKKTILEKMPPFLSGGDMVLTVSEQTAQYRELPWRFEAGTPNIADVVAMKAALEYREEFTNGEIEKHGKKLLEYAKKVFSYYPQVKLFTPKSVENVGPILAFAIQGIHPHDIASIFNEEGIAIRSGQHCAEPLLVRLGVNALARMSFAIYNTVEDIDRAEMALKKVLKIFKNP